MSDFGNFAGAVNAFQSKDGLLTKWERRRAATELIYVYEFASFSARGRRARRQCGHPNERLSVHR